jgi:hypothetical protein
MVTRFSGNAALQENAASARPNATNVLLSRDIKGLIKDALEGTMRDIAKNLFKAAVNRGMVSSLQKLIWTTKRAAKTGPDLLNNNILSIMISPSL